jgi:membrane protease YdiL (CAAX protease family)
VFGLATSAKLAPPLKPNTQNNFRMDSKYFFPGINETGGNEMDSKSLSSVGIARHKQNLFFFALAWIVLDLLILLPVQQWLNGSFPLFTFIWLLPPFITLLISKDPGRIGVSRVALKMFLPVCGLNVLGVFLVMILLEPWSHAYRTLIVMALGSPTPDTTFAWLLRFPGAPGMIAMFFYTVLVTIFAEELFFRGWLLQWLGKRMPAFWAILLQALFFSLPQAIVALFLTLTQAVVYLAGYSFLAIGMIGGWAAWRTKSIWPSLITASLMNLILVLIVR